MRKRWAAFEDCACKGRAGEEMEVECCRSQTDRGGAAETVGGIERRLCREAHAHKGCSCKEETPDHCGGSGADYCGYQKTVGGFSRSEEARGGEEGGAAGREKGRSKESW